MKYQIKTLVIAVLGLMTCAAHASLLDLSDVANDDTLSIRLTQAADATNQAVPDSIGQRGLEETKQVTIAALSNLAQPQWVGGALGMSAISWHSSALSAVHVDKKLSIEDIHFHYQSQPSAVPLPATLWLFVSGLLGVAGRKFWVNQARQRK